ncbi:uncharacterized protein LOC109852736 isoform X2 [Pseudomyrmex gracilis]|uniref:uncharacterized protein LOC109852736 isoform X2 n=1 Tax=Pseudomyrmex gracilis TaxID=219809 RepID=UPI0009952C01|nr:uncharacterized protein LOC109852736 isoform X2 [Pseudomyrmex gracilis]
MCCFEHSYSGIFQNKANRRACFVGASVVEVLDKSFHAGIATIELSPLVKAYLSAGLVTVIILAVLYLLSATLHLVLLKNSKCWLRCQLIATTIKVVLVLLLLALLSMTKVEGWNATGLVSSTLITVVIIKLFGIAIACSNLVDMSGDWSYLIEFGFGVILIAIVLGIELLVIMHTLTAAVIVAAILGTFLSLISLMDLHQNMSINSWWWEEKLLNGCMYHVLRQYTLLWCLRIEEKPRAITIFDSASQEKRQDDVTA